MVNGVWVHFVHERGVGEHPLPIILTHGYPDSFLRFSKIIPMLTHPEAHGADPADAFDVVAPSLPGFGFSDKPTKPGAIFRVGDLWQTLMTDVLGYERFAARDTSTSNAGPRCHAADISSPWKNPNCSSTTSGASSVRCGRRTEHERPTHRSHLFLRLGFIARSK